MALSPRLIYAGNHLVNVDHLDCVKLVSVGGKLPSASKVVVGGFELDLTVEQTAEFLKTLGDLNLVPPSPGSAPPTSMAPIPASAFVTSK